MTSVSHSLQVTVACLLSLLAVACKPRAVEPVAAAASAAARATGCLPGGDGYLRAQLHGAREVRIDWNDAQMQCEGSTRPDASGIRVSIGGNADAEGPIRFVFGVSATRPGENGRALPTNLTAIFEGQDRIYATLGDDKCTVDQLRQQPITGTRAFRVEARGFCILPATVVGGSEHLLVSTFDFAARVDPEIEPAAPPAVSSPL